MAAVLAIVAAATTVYASPCALPPSLRVVVEEQGGVRRGGTVLVALEGSCCGLRAGDVVRQANSARVAHCADLEPVAAEALAKGVALLLGVERDGTLVGIAAITRDDETRIAARAPDRLAAGEVGSSGGGARTTERDVTTATGRAATTAGAETSAPRVPPTGARDATVASARQPPRARRVATLPAAADATPELRRRASAAAAALARVDESASTNVPLGVYERRLGDAEAAVAALEFGLSGAESAVRDFVEDAIALHRTARDVRRAQLQSLGQAAVDRRGASAAVVPYFSDSRVPDWVAAYPFLGEAVVEPPRETRMPFPGEASGRWNAERGLELLWQHARAATEALATWSHA